jgi:hypothetical protein
MLKYEWSMLEQNSFDLFTVFFGQAFDLFSNGPFSQHFLQGCNLRIIYGNVLLAASYEFDNWVSMTKGFITLSY